MKKSSKLLFICVAVFVLCLVCGCGGDKRKLSEVTATYHIYEYEEETETFEEVTDNVLRYGTDYVFGFELEFTDLKFSKSEVTLQVDLGRLDDAVNMELYDYGTSEPEKNQFYKTEEGIWQMEFDASSRGVPDFSENLFWLSVDSLEKATDTIALSLSSEKYRFKINELNELQIPIKLVEGTFDFTTKNFMKSGDFILKVPQNCTDIKVAIYADEKYSKLCGTQVYDSTEFIGNVLIVDIAETALTLLKENKKENEIFTAYLRITAEGGNDYLMSTMETELIID